MKQRESRARRLGRPVYDGPILRRRIAYPAMCLDCDSCEEFAGVATIKNGFVCDTCGHEEGQHLPMPTGDGPEYDEETDMRFKCQACKVEMQVTPGGVKCGVCGKVVEL